MNKSEFKETNRQGWLKNTDYWLNNPLRQVEDTKDFFKTKLRDLIFPGCVLADMGCGSGWLLDFVAELNVGYSYYGLDFNESFIDYLKKKYVEKPQAVFYMTDLEQALPDSLSGSCDVVFNLFNFFETADLTSAFKNGRSLLKKDGKLVILTIDCTFLILALSHDMAEFKEKLAEYERIKSTGEVPYFFQNIDLGDGESQTLKYASVLYSLDDYYKQAKANGMKLVDYGEIIKTSKFLPKTYQYLVFQ